MNEEYVPEHILTGGIVAPVGGASPLIHGRLRAKRMTCVGDQSLPRAVGIRRWLSPAAIALLRN
jgi:hypothetical protein